jgi:uncharacterized protein YbjT (DUF2867 family)
MFLVTGSTGNVGAELPRALLRANQRVRALVHVNSRPDLSAGAELVREISIDQRRFARPWPASEESSCSPAAEG